MQPSRANHERLFASGRSLRTQGTSFRGTFMDVKLRLVVILLILYAPSPASGGDHQSGGAKIRLTLDSAVALALEQNRDVMIAEQERYRADAQVNEAWSGALPQLSLTG